MAKYGLLGDARFFNWLEENSSAVLALEPDAIMHAILRSCEAKARIVEADEREAGKRALLNLGHTFAHAFEVEAGYNGSLLHGEAVAAGLGLAFDLSVDLGICAADHATRCKAHLQTVGLPSGQSDLATGNIPVHRLIEHMKHDKKMRNGKLHFILVRAIGDAFVCGDVPSDKLKAYLREIKMLSSLWILASIILILILASAFFSSAETALTAASDARMRQLASKGNERALIVEALRADREGLIGSILIGNNAVNVFGSALATSVAISLFGEGGLVWATIAMTVLLVVFAEVMPKPMLLPMPIVMRCALLLP